MVCIRPAVADDTDAVISLASVVPEAPLWSRAVYEGFRSPINPLKRLFVAESEGRIVGFLACQIIAGTCELQSIAVESSVRQRGVGKALLATLLEWLRENRIARVELEVRAGNTTAIDFYTRVGFLQDGLRRNYYQHPQEDAVLMSMVLNPAPNTPLPGGKLSTKSD